MRGVGEYSDRDEARLSIVRQALLEHRDLSDLLRSEAFEGRIIRLLPVSAVGDDFAELRPDGTVAKIKGATAEPHNTDLPFAAVAKDYFDELAAELSTSEERSLQDGFWKRRLQPTPKAIASGVRLLSETTKAALLVAFGATNPTMLAAEPLVGLFFDWVSRPLLGREEQEAGSGLSDEEIERARQSSRRVGVLDDLEKTIWAFEGDHPSSVLRRGRS